MQNKGLMVCVVILMMGFSAKAEGDRAAKAAIPVPVESPAADARVTPDESEGESDNRGYEVVNAAVNVIRKNARTEVMFRNGEVYTMPSGKAYHEVYTACEESERTGKAISVVVNPRSKTIVSVSGGKKKRSSEGPR